MKGAFRVLGLLALSMIVIFTFTMTAAVVKKVWFSKHAKDTSGDHVAVVDLSGVIMGVGSKLRDLEELTEDTSTKAIVVRINSPGGLVAPSQELYEAIRRADTKIPVVISMGSLAASGGYYAALAGRKIYANPGTLTASIGVIMEFANTQKLYQWAKIERFTLKAGKFKDIGSPLRDMTPEEKALMTSMLTDIHKQFRDTVKERRKLTDAELDNSADGRIMTGSQAKAAKLVDELGGFDDAVKAAKELAKLPAKAPVVYPEDKSSLFKRIIFGEDEASELADLSARLKDNFLPPFALNRWQIMLLAPLAP